ncbi:hypothetical protein SLEP1_g24976 [Rubroshorea leprosula]|uniref:Uncharacterized protein n=1 Tax=Rubroshorea leprosula TaxID=152421 RepID=A0AAV5JUR1_9ROSI|nr:hypothetical protein SLEP1_g24976 [Rubroshorea leprosula]
MVEQGDKLDLVEQDVKGQCNSECKTIEGACQEIIGSSDTNVAEYIYKSIPDIESLINYLRKDLTEACSTNPPPVPKDRIPGEPFEPKPTNEAEMEKILRSMEGMPGAPSMKMYSREELMNMKNFVEDADADEDEDDDSPFPSKLGKILREKASAKGKWKPRITKGITHTEEALKKHAKWVSYRVQKWWKVFKTARSKNAKDSNAEL